MELYSDFAHFYANGPYPIYSQNMAEHLGAVLAKFDCEPKDILDLACGEGTFAVIMANRGCKVTGVDRSGQMLEFARQKATAANAEVEFIPGDITNLQFDKQFDLVTCWFDSLNYLLTETDLQAAFSGAARALRKGGLFVFDMNTIYGLSCGWQQFPCFLQQDNAELFEVHRPDYDEVTSTASLKITGFRKSGKHWIRIDEEHCERGYTIFEIRRCLRMAGLRELACWGSLENMTPLEADSGRVWFVSRRPRNEDTEFPLHPGR